MFLIGSIAGLAGRRRQGRDGAMSRLLFVEISTMRVQPCCKAGSLGGGGAKQGHVRGQLSPLNPLCAKAFNQCAANCWRECKVTNEIRIRECFESGSWRWALR